jgi:hypothetical protein
LGSQATTEESSFFSISMSLRGKGLECPELPPGDDTAERAGEAAAAAAAATPDDVLVIRLVGCELTGLSGEDDKAVNGGAIKDGDERDCDICRGGGWTLITPAATELETGTKTAAAAAAGMVIPPVGALLASGGESSDFCRAASSKLFRKESRCC